jgi:glutaredoxin
VTATVTLYVRADCPLCEEAERLLTGMQERLEFRLQKLDISLDPAMEFEYRWAVPIVKAAGREIARAPIRAAALEADLGEALAGTD